MCMWWQILVEQALVDVWQQEQGSLHVTQPTAAGPTQIARRNYELLLHRRSTVTAALQLTCSTSSLSGPTLLHSHMFCCVAQRQSAWCRSSRASIRLTHKLQLLPGHITICCAALLVFTTHVVISRVKVNI